VLVLDGQCEYNLVTYVATPERLADADKVAIFVQPAGVRALNVLAAEGQIDPDRFTLLAFELADGEVKVLQGSELADFGDLVEREKSKSQDDALDEQVRQLDAMSADQRFAFWREQFARCIKCYACRQVCPMCYCQRCIVEANQPQWVCTSSHDLGNYEWNIVRAFHLAGRCVECGNCQRACPADIPLMLLNRKLAQEVTTAFDYFPGQSTDQQPALADFTQDDAQDFIL